MIRLVKQSSILFILSGIIFLALYRAFADEAYSLFLFVASAVLLSLGVNRLATMLDDLFSKSQDFWEVF